MIEINFSQNILTFGVLKGLPCPENHASVQSFD